MMLVAGPLLVALPLPATTTTGLAVTMDRTLTMANSEWIPLGTIVAGFTGLSFWPLLLRAAARWRSRSTVTSGSTARAQSTPTTRRRSHVADESTAAASPTSACAGMPCLVSLPWLSLA